MPPFEHHPENALHLIQYRPHHNCARVAEFVGLETDCGELCDSNPDAGDSDERFDLSHGRTVWPGEWISKRPDGSFEVVTADELVDYITGTTHTHLET